MKKTLSLCLTVIIAGILMTGCGILEKFETANGIVLYGTEQQVKDVFDQEKEEYKEKAGYQFKVAEDGDQKIVILGKKTATALVERGLIKEVKNDGTDTESVKSITEVTKDNAVLFAKEETNEITLDGQKFKVTYDGNKIIGDRRAYGDKILIIEDTEFSSIKGTEKMIGIMKYKKDPKEKMGRFDVERDQLVKIKH